MEPKVKKLLTSRITPQWRKEELMKYTNSTKQYLKLLVIQNNMIERCRTT